MGNPHGSFIWYELMTPEPGGAITFYDQVIGFTIDRDPVEGMDYRMITVPDGMVGGVLTLTNEMREHGARPCWLAYIGVDDVDATVEKLLDLGGSVLMPARDLPVGRIAMVADPDGAPFYVMKDASGETSTAFVGGEGSYGHANWNELATRDQDRAFAFYSALFGWEKGEGMDMGPDAGWYQMLDRGGQSFGAMMDAQGEMPAMWNIYFRVPSIQISSDLVPVLGGTIYHGPLEIPGGDSIVIGGDPEGATFALVGPL
jgi:predicted enzyme related to lactoylglutathione lyase